MVDGSVVMEVGGWTTAAAVATGMARYVSDAYSNCTFCE